MKKEEESILVLQISPEGPCGVIDHKLKVRSVSMAARFFSSHVQLQRCLCGVGGTGLGQEGLVKWKSRSHMQSSNEGLWEQVGWRKDHWKRAIQGSEQTRYWIGHLHVDIARCSN